MANIVIKNRQFTLTIGEDCAAKSLLYTPEGKPAVECLKQDEHTPMFSITEDRPYNNEIKLAYPNREITMQANRVRAEGDNRLIVGFELVGFEAIVEYKVADDYISFKFIDFIVKPEHFGNLCMTPPPVAKFRMIQLPVKNRERFGEWLNVMWDDEVAVNVLATCPEATVNAIGRKGYRIMTADASRGIKLRGCEAALIVTAPEKLLDCIEAVEEDYDLPRGVASRRCDRINRSSMKASLICPANVDEYIAFAKKGGFTMVHINYMDFTVCNHGYDTCGEYEYSVNYPRGDADLKYVLDRLHAEGIGAGLHILHTHIGIKTKYVTPVLDHRLHLTRHFTLAKPLGMDDDVIYVEENPVDTVMHEKCRVLKFDGEAIYYDSYTTEYPYCFKGCKRGFYDTTVTPHEQGTIGGILDITEFSATSIYLDQNSSLQDEIAEKIAHLFDLGFDYMYFDGSEGTNAPFDYHVSNAQYRVYKKLQHKPLYCEAAAKSHFGWHMISGGNAFDIFGMNVFKEKLIEHPFEEVQRTQNDFTRVNFGWWYYDRENTQPDIYEFGTSKAAAWDCPVTVRFNLADFKESARIEDNLEVMRRWEDVRVNKLMTEEMRAALRNADKEYTLLIDEAGKYELVEQKHLTDAAGGNKRVRVFTFERNGKACASLWHTVGAGKLSIPIAADKFIYETELGMKDMAVEAEAEASVIALDRRRYITADCTPAELAAALNNAKLIEA